MDGFLGGDLMTQSHINGGGALLAAEAYLPGQAFAEWRPAEDRLVHKVSAAANFIARWRSTCENTAELTASWAAEQEYHCLASQGMSDPMLALETFRQAVIIVAHSMYGVPLESAFSLQHIGISLDSCRMTGTPDLWLELTPDFSGTRLIGLGIRVTFRLDKAIIGTGRGKLIVLEQHSYHRVRNGAEPKEFRSPGLRAEASHVGRTCEEDVLLNEGGGDLLINTSHKWLFDHPADHIPGMLVIDAARQAFALNRGGDPSFNVISARFFNYGELHEPVQIATDVPDGPSGDECSFIFKQLGRTLAIVAISSTHSGQASLP
ncbi:MULTISPECIES: AfsA-related hotdog domain-containing protein [Micrococcaceae]|uniref:AfsA-related hotdog domain-containing protein n=1 Tax=Micrococcaceae TaxID=1268 RepID=UPI0027DF2F86|nr:MULTISPECIES: AfsA-related hotdog domain-containing protein [Micrococcaceae]